jgi:hypothetical protein
MEMRKWIDGLNEDDLAFLKRFIMSSGSLKELARLYGISYPTVRLRLDRLIAKVGMLDDGDISSEFERLLRALYADGKIDAETQNTIRIAHQKEMEEKQ